MDNNPEEKKCPVCGRPNLNKAEKCWYCQAPLDEKPASRQNSLLSEEEMQDQSGGGSSFVNSSTDGNPKGNENSTPEWLRRVRELIAAEKIEEEPVDEWQQQHLFDPSEKGPQKKSPPTEKEPRHTSNPPAKKTPSPMPDKTSQHTEKQEQEEHLPDGFTHFSTNPDD
ncbi:MAG: hypothetical protein GYA52_01255 [Chloroflexi bacterium]|jgi:hypothetical protein|nr:hypothetical protein [Chloroflexota bacterium]